MKRCRFCGVLLDIERNWWTSSSCRRDYGCIKCGSKKNQDYRLHHAASIKRLNAEYYQSHGSAVRARRKLHYSKNREVTRRQQKEYNRRLKSKCIEKLGGRCTLCGEIEHAFLTFGHLRNGDGAKHRREGSGYHDGAHFYLRMLRGELMEYPLQLECFNCNNAKTSVGDLRGEAIAAYGGKCSCCGEARTNRLTLGHPDNDGGMHRKLIDASKKTFYRHIKRAGYPAKPDGFNIEVQCWNCNLGAEVNSGFCPHKSESIRRNEKLGRRGTERLT
jgi:hypothetical protein